MFWHRVSSATDVRIGGVYVRDCDWNSNETARVVSVEGDQMGVPHVRYSRTFYLGNEVTDRSSRLLGIDSFLRQYQLVGDPEGT